MNQNSMNSMTWDEVRLKYPNAWVVFEAQAAHTEGAERVIDRIFVDSSLVDASEAMQHYQRLHKEDPSRELYVAHTSRESLDIEERLWLGIRKAS